jgi:hypothetical protein
MTRLVAVVAFLVLVAAAPWGVAVEQDPMELGRLYCTLFYDGEVERIWENMTGEMQAALVEKGNLVTFREQAFAQLGSEAAIVSESVEEADGFSVYLRTVRFEKLDQLIHVQWAFDANGRVAGFFIRPVQTEAPTEFLDYETQTALRLPFDGDWYVFWGGRSLAQNYHTAFPDQRFAYDLLMMKDGSTHAGDGSRNEDYYCFGQRIVTPGAGVVVEMKNSVEDNIPGVMNPNQALGNHVIIDHGNGEYSFLAHFKQDTVAVQKGQKLEAGEFLGLCGNSGNSSEPHLHFHLQTTVVFQHGDGLPAQFENYIADGEVTVRGEPTKGTTIRQR